MMKQRIMTLCIAALMVVQGYCGVTLTVPDVNIAPGSSSNVVIYYDLVFGGQDADEGLQGLFQVPRCAGGVLWECGQCVVAHLL